jgi:hypothetical protein
MTLTGGFSPVAMVHGIGRFPESNPALDTTSFPGFDPVLAAIGTHALRGLNRRGCLGREKRGTVKSSRFRKRRTLSRCRPQSPLLHRQHRRLEKRTRLAESQETTLATFPPEDGSSGRVEVQSLSTPVPTKVRAVIFSRSVNRLQ